MPITVTRDDERKLILAVGAGPITADDVFAFVREHRAGILQTYRLLVDGRQAQMRAQLSDATKLADQVAAQARLTGGRGPTAIVAGTAVYLLATAYETLSHGAGVHVIRVFRQIDEARQWLMAQPVAGSPGAPSPASKND